MKPTAFEIGIHADMVLVGTSSSALVLVMLELGGVNVEADELWTFGKVELESHMTSSAQRAPENDQLWHMEKTPRFFFSYQWSQLYHHAQSYQCIL